MEELQNGLSLKDIEDVFASDFKKSHVADVDENTIFKFFEHLSSKNYKDRKEYDTTIKYLFNTMKLHISKSTMVHYYRLLLKQNKIKFNPSLEIFMKRKIARSASGVVVITVFTGPSKFSCPMDCHYCPQERDEKGNMTQPRSYLSTEPGCARAIQNNFDPIKQTLDRIASLEMMGHIDPTPESPCKLEFIVSGGTFNFYPKDYLMNFMTCLYYACNCYYEFQNYLKHNTPIRPMKSIEEEQKINETATHRIIGLTIETRPDWITKKGTHFSNDINLDEIKLFRQYGVTRIQIGVQHTDDEILKKINRKCTDIENQWGIFILKQNGFKVDIHIMLDLPFSSPEKDKVMLQKIIDDPNYQADQWKLYPTMVVNWTKVKEWYDKQEYRPYAEMVSDKGEAEYLLKDVLKYVKRQVYPWIRINRVIRDIPAKSIIGGTTCSNMRDILIKEMNEEGTPCKCIRCREVKNQNYDTSNIKFKINKYNASNGTEYFLSYTSHDENILYGYLRLRFNNNNYGVLEYLHDTALVRELHVLGMQVSVNKSDGINEKTQHKGLGTKLVKYAEYISMLHGYKKIAIISGVGVRNYYKKRGYKLENTYMVKKLYNIYLILPIIVIVLLLFIFSILYLKK